MQDKLFVLCLGYITFLIYILKGHILIAHLFFFQTNSKETRCTHLMNFTYRSQCETASITLTIGRNVTGPTVCLGGIKRKCSILCPNPKEPANSIW